MTERQVPVGEDGDPALDLLAKVQEQYQAYLVYSRLYDLTAAQPELTEVARSTSGLQPLLDAFIEL